MSARRRRGPLRPPWQKDPDDREANYKRPIKRADQIRLLARGIVIAVAYLWFRTREQTGDHEGAAAAAALGACIAFAGSLGVWAARRGELEEIFFSSRRHQVWAQALLTGSGLLIFVLGVLSLD